MRYCKTRSVPAPGMPAFLSAPTVGRGVLPWQRFHDLRHGAASLMLAQDMNPKVMQEEP